MPIWYKPTRYAPYRQTTSWHVAHDALVTRLRDVVCISGHSRGGRRPPCRVSRCVQGSCVCVCVWSMRVGVADILCGISSMTMQCSSMNQDVLTLSLYPHAAPTHPATEPLVAVQNTALFEDMAGRWSVEVELVYGPRIYASASRRGTGACRVSDSPVSPWRQQLNSS